MAQATDRLARLTDEIVECRACPRLVEWREQVAREKRASFRDETYWGRPVPGFGDPGARVLVAGLAPAAHGGNRTGRVFTGDRSGDWLFASLHRTGFANQPTSVSRRRRPRAARRATSPPRCGARRRQQADARGARHAACRTSCARARRSSTRVRVIVVLGAFAYDARRPGARGARLAAARCPRPKFAHGVEVPTARAVVLGCFHPSQQNTFTGS